MTFRIGKTTIRGFGPFVSAELDYSAPGLTVVEGEVVGRAGCSSNGSGKSACLEAPIWALTGRLVRDGTSVDDVVHQYAGSCEVRTSLMGDDGTSIAVARYRKDSKYGNAVRLWVSGKEVTRGTSQETDAAIERYLGVDYTTLLNTVAFGARSDVRDFFSAADADRKKLLDRLLGLSIYAAARKVATQRAQGMSAEVEQTMNAELGLATRIMERQTLLAEIDQGGDETDDVKLAHARIRARQLRDAAQQVAVEHGKVESVLRAAQASYVADAAKAEKVRAQARDAARRVREELKGLFATTIRIKAEIEELRKFTGFVKGQIGQRCPTCRQPVTKDGVKVASAECAARVDELEQQRCVADAAHAAKDAEAKEAERASTAVESPSREAVDAAQSALNDSSRKLAAAEGACREALGALAAIEAAVAKSREMRQRVEKEITELQAEQNALVAKREKMRAEQARVDFWVEGFGNGGVRSFLMEAEMPEINRAATRYAQRLLGAGTRIRLRPTTKLKSKDAEREKIEVEATIPECAQSYACASKGQRHRLDLSLILAFREVVARRSPSAIDQLFCDELFDGVDQAGVECVVEILAEMAQKCPVMLVTHDERLKSVGDRVVRIRHERGAARIVGVSE